MKAFISVVIPAFNEQAHIAQCINALKNQTYPPSKYEIIVIDNNSSDKTFSIAKETGVTVLKKYEGPVGAVRNYGAQHAKGEILAFIDADCIAPSNWLETGAKLVNNNHKTVFGGGYLLREDPNWIEKGWLLGDQAKNVPKELLGGCIFISRDAFNVVSGFSELITSGEDTKLSFDLKAADFNVSITAELSVIHLGNPTTIRSFFKRQVWHSENYLLDLKSSLKDLTFILSALYLVLVALIIPASLFSHRLLFLFATLISLIPLALSVKRIYRAGPININIFFYPIIYFIDWLYITARSFSIMKSIINKL